MNTNLFHNIINIVLIALGAITGGLLAAGCVEIPTGGLDCSASLVPPALAGWIVAALGTVKMIVNVVRDGFGGLVRPQPPVEQ